MTIAPPEPYHARGRPSSATKVPLGAPNSEKRWSPLRDAKIILGSTVLRIWKAVSLKRIAISRSANVQWRSSLIARNGTSAKIVMKPTISSSVHPMFTSTTSPPPTPSPEKALLFSVCCTTPEIVMNVDDITTTTVRIADERNERRYRSVRDTCRFSQITSAGSGAIATVSGPDPRIHFSDLHSAMQCCAASTVSNVTKTVPVHEYGSLLIAFNATSALYSRCFAWATPIAARFFTRPGWSLLFARYHATWHRSNSSRRAARAREAMMSSR